MNTIQHEPEDLGYTIVDGRMVLIANHVAETKYGREYTRLDAPYGYKKRVRMKDGAVEECTVFVTRGFFGKERFATVSRPASDPLVAYRCVRLTWR